MKTLTKKRMSLACALLLTAALPAQLCAMEGGNKAKEEKKEDAPKGSFWTRAKGYAQEQWQGKKDEVKEEVGAAAEERAYKGAKKAMLPIVALLGALVLYPLSWLGLKAMTDGDKQSDGVKSFRKGAMMKLVAGIPSALLLLLVGGKWLNGDFCDTQEGKEQHMKDKKEMEDKAEDAFADMKKSADEMAEDAQTGVSRFNRFLGRFEGIGTAFSGIGKAFDDLGSAAFGSDKKADDKEGDK